MTKGLNKVSLIGNITKDPEVRDTPQGGKVCSFTVATNWSYKTSTGEAKEETEFHKVIAWNKLAELCGQLLKKGSRCFIGGRLKSREFTPQGSDRPITVMEVMADDMLVL